MKIIDFERKGNLVRFHLGKDSVSNYTGEGWADKPYTQAGKVDDQYTTGICDVVFPFDTLVLEPSVDDCCEYTKNDMRAGIVPCIVVVPVTLQFGTDNTQFSHWAGVRDSLKFYFNDRMEPTRGVASYQLGKWEIESEYVTKIAEPTYSSTERPHSIPLWQKHCLTIDEAALYFGIGQNRIRELTENRDCPFLLFVGKKRMIKRQIFEKYLDGQFSV